MPTQYVFSSESVSEGHPDKVCDQISDAIVDFLLSHDREARVAAEVLATTNRLVIAGEIRAQIALSQAELQQEINAVARAVVQDIGYAQDGFHWENLCIDNYLHDQSLEIAQAVDATENSTEGAGDQGIMFGYACDETPELMPAPISYAHKMLHTLSQRRRAGDERLQPDAKSQFSLIYQDGYPVGVDSVVVSTQHQARVSQQELHELITAELRDLLPENWSMPEKVLVNPSGQFVIGGPDGDAGLTGRKIIVDTYGGATPHGGGAFSGKDATKVDRSAAYMARYLAKNIVAAGLARRCTIQLCYAIGIVQPLAIYVDCLGTGKRDNHTIEKWISNNVDLSPRGIIETLQLQTPIYRPTASYGHFGRSVGSNGEFRWEALDLTEKLQELL